MKELQRNRRQLSARLVPELVRDVLDRFVRGELTCSEAMDSLEVKRSRLYTLRTEFLKAKASGEGASWAPRLSGGNHYEAWPDEVLHFLHKALKQENEPFSYAFAASEVITGWTTALLHMQEGEHWEVYVPYQLAYGESGRGDIPGHSVLIFDMRLERVIHPEGPDDRSRNALEDEV